MKIGIIVFVGASSIVLVIMMQSSINIENIQREEVTASLEFAMTQTMQELMEKNSYAVRNTNEMMAMFLQEMLARVEGDMNLTVISHACDYEKGFMDMEAVGEFTLPGNRIKKVSVRRCMKLAE